MIEVEGPDGSVAEFPDGTSPDVIKATMRKRFGAGEAPPGYGGASVDKSDPRAKWDFFGDTARAYNESKDSLMNREPGKLGNSIGMAGDVLGMLFSPLTGATHAYGGSALSYLPGMDKTKGDAAMDQAMMGLGPRGFTAKGAILPKMPTPSVGELKRVSDAGYSAARNSGMEINPASTQKLANDIRADLVNKGFREINEPKTFAAVDELKSPAGASVQIADIDQPRRVLGNIGPGSSDANAAGRARRAIDEYLENVPPGDVVSGDPARVAGTLKEARGNYSAAKRAELIDEALHKAELNAASAGSGANIDNAIRQQLKAIAKDPEALRGFSNEEIAQLEKVVKGSWTGNTLRVLGNLLGGGGGIGTFITAGAGGLAMGPGGVALPAVGMASKRLGAMSTKRQADILSDMLRARSPLGQSLQGGPVGPPLPRNSPLLDALVFGQDADAMRRYDEPVSAFFP